MLPDRPRDRRLSAAEQKRLVELERRLAAEDPRLAALLRGGWPPAARTAPEDVSPGAFGGWAAVACVLVLLAALVGGPAGAAAMVLALLALAAGWVLVRFRHIDRRD